MEMSVDDKFRRAEKKSSSFLSSLISQKATFAAALQAITDVRPGNITRYHNFNDFKIESYLKYTVNLNQPIIDLATRGIMVERNFIDMDEIDTGWIISNAIQNQNEISNSGFDHYVGMLIMFSPIAISASFLLSDGGEFSLESLQRYSSEFLQNSTPEDAENLFTALYNLRSERFSFINNFSETLIEGTNYILEEEINLFELFTQFEKDSIIFSEMSKEYNFCFNKGYQAFKEAIDSKCSITDAITHTFITVLAHHTPKMFGSKDQHTAYKIKQEAIELMEIGGYLTAKGKILTSKFDNMILNFDKPIPLTEIAELTSTISFISLLNNDYNF